MISQPSCGAISKEAKPTRLAKRTLLLRYSAKTVCATGRKIQPQDSQTLKRAARNAIPRL